ncbi:hypothetical protein B0F90DRAFT_1821585 [Multifurca ochricompacta]|uniref:Uncharacterized protein n=1 Tax=Multifurca ochricompacta TaxID=376703 RepID=A0AAD4LXY1_9AGAM|nr:hypothetical protein B0F90DRAFT_1821585 [Multifurca ochricompacta]
MQLTKEYPNRLLSDISEDIRIQIFFLDALGRQLAMAESLRRQAIHLQKVIRGLNSELCTEGPEHWYVPPHTHLPEDIDRWRHFWGSLELALAVLGVWLPPSNIARRYSSPGFQT